MEEQQDAMTENCQQAATDAGRATARPASVSGDLDSLVPGDAGDRALSITCPGPIAGGVGCQYLACGIDTLDVGISVGWGSDWEALSETLDREKERASGSDGVLIRDGRCLMWPSGLRPNYRWHLQWPEFHLFIAKSQLPEGKAPNVLAKIGSRALWEHSLPNAIEIVRREIESLGGLIIGMKPSRCDLAADFFVPGGLSLEFLLAHRVPAHGEHSHHMRGESLETFYHGGKKSPTLLRIYDKGQEIAKAGDKWWFLQVWERLSVENVWRVEYQLRRPTLKKFGIHTIDDLRSNLGGLWKYLTEDWFSLRQDDNGNVSRCSYHPWWVQVQGCAEKLGNVAALSRVFDGEPADSAWFVNHTAGCVASFAAREGISDLETACVLLFARIEQYWNSRDFGRAVTVRSIPLGVSVGSETESDLSNLYGMDSENDGKA